QAGDEDGGHITIRGLAADERDAAGAEEACRVTSVPGNAGRPQPGAVRPDHFQAAAVVATVGDVEEDDPATVREPVRPDGERPGLWHSARPGPVPEIGRASCRERFENVAIDRKVRNNK